MGSDANSRPFVSDWIKLLDPELAFSGWGTGCCCGKAHIFGVGSVLRIEPDFRTWELSPAFPFPRVVLRHWSRYSLKRDQGLKEWGSSRARSRRREDGRSWTVEGKAEVTACKEQVLRVLTGRTPSLSPRKLLSEMSKPVMRIHAA